MKVVAAGESLERIREQSFQWRWW